MLKLLLLPLGLLCISMTWTSTNAIQVTTPSASETNGETFTATILTRRNGLGVVRFEVLAPDGGVMDEPIYRGATNAQGLAKVELPRSAASLGMHRGTLKVRTIEPGFQSLLGFSNGSWSKGTEDFTFYLPMEKGGTVFVQTVDKTGQAVPMGVSWRTSGIPLSEGTEAISRQGGGSSGWSAFHFKEDMNVDFLASSTRNYSGSLVNVPLRVDNSPTQLQLDVDQGTSKRGRVLDLDGAPISGLSVNACWAGPEAIDDLMEMCEAPLNDWGLQASGALYKYSTTNDEGFFSVNGLRPGLYRLSAKGIALLTGGDKGPFFAVRGGVQQEAALVFELPVLRITANGNPMIMDEATLHIPGEKYDQMVWKLNERHKWPAKPFPQVWRASDNSPLDPFVGFFNAYTPPGGEANFVLDPSEDYWVTVVGGAFDGKPVLLNAVHRGANPIVSIAPHAKLELGTLQVRAVSRRGDACDQVHLTIESLYEGVTLANNGDYHGNDLRAQLPAGLYRVIAEGASSPDFQGFQGCEHRTLGRTEQIVEVSAGQDIKVDVELLLGARIRLKLDFQVDRGDRVDALRSKERAPAWGSIPAENSTHAEIYLLASTGRKHIVSWDQGPTPGITDGCNIRAFWPIGESHTSEYLPTGNFWLIAELAGGRAFKQRVRLRPGDIMQVTLGPTEEYRTW